MSDQFGDMIARRRANRFAVDATISNEWSKTGPTWSGEHSLFANPSTNLFDFPAKSGDPIADALELVIWMIAEKDETFDAATKATLERALREAYTRVGNTSSPTLEALLITLSEMEGETASWLHTRLEEKMAQVARATGHGIFIGLGKGNTRPIIIPTPMDFTVFTTDPSEGH